MMNDLPLPSDVRFRLEVRAAALGIFRDGQPSLEGLADFHMALLGSEGLSPRQAYEAFDRLDDADLVALHRAYRRAWDRSKDWVSRPVRIELQPDVEARLWALAAELDFTDLSRLANAYVLARTNYEAPTPADIEAAMEDRAYPDMAALVRAVAEGEVIKTPTIRLLN